MKYKLIRVEKAVSIHNKEDEFIGEVIIDINLNILREIVIPHQDDPDLYDGYGLNMNQLNTINTYLKDPIPINLEEEKYFLIAGGIYDWDAVVE